jgi:hypothetical protein
MTDWGKPGILLSRSDAIRGYENCLICTLYGRFIVSGELPMVQTLSNYLFQGTTVHSKPRGLSS